MSEAEWMRDMEAEEQTSRAANWVNENYNGHWEMFVNPVAIKEEIESLQKQLASEKAHTAFIKRWVQRVHDRETTLQEFYGVLRYYEPLKPVEAALTQPKE